jgi:hypothetical protein
MFDPTIYDNLKVVVEGSVYDLDLGGKIVVTGRSDSIELSAMSRRYTVTFRLQDSSDVSAEIRLTAGTEDLAGEILELSHMNPGCRLELVFHKTVIEPHSECPAIGRVMQEIWGEEARIAQYLTYEFPADAVGSQDEIAVDFGRKFGEDVIGDLPRLLEHMVMTLERLEAGD